MSEDEGMLPVVLGHAADSEIREEFLRADKPLEQTPQLVFIDNGEFVLPLAFNEVAAAIGELLAVLHKPQEIRFELLVILNIIEL
jgi:hypothetical protein